MPSYLPIKTQVLLHSWTNRYQHLTNFIRWKFPIQRVSRIGKGFVTFVWWGHLKWQVADHIARGGVLQHDGLIAALFCEADTIPMRHWLHFWNLTESWLSADLGILSSHCAVPTAAEMRRDWEHTQKPWRATKEEFVLTTSLWSPSPARGCEETSEYIFLHVVHIAEIFVRCRWRWARAKS